MKALVLFSFISLFSLSALAQSIRVNDTDFSKGRLGFQQEISLEDLTKLHGHLCDGLAEGFLALRQGLFALYPDSVADRTNTRALSKPSPCLADAALYLTGGRYQYHSFWVDTNFEGLYILQRTDSGKAVAVIRKQGVKPAVIDQMGDRAIVGELSACELDELRNLEDQYLKFLLKTDPTTIFEVKELKDFKWEPRLRSNFPKTDILNKYAPTCRR